MFDNLNKRWLFRARVLPSQASRQVRTILQRDYGFSTGLIRQIKNEGLLFVNDNKVYFNHFVNKWDLIEILLPLKSKIVPEHSPLDIVYEDSDVIIVDKSAGVIMHPRHQHISGTLANYIAGYLSAKGEGVSSYLINRLDRGTSGLVLAAKNPLAALILSSEINNAKKEYLALVNGYVQREEGQIELPILDPKEGMKRVTSSIGKDALTKYLVIKRFSNATLLRVVLGSGRTHQIRVHLSVIGHPIVGDDLYGDKTFDVETKRPFLHASSLVFQHPKTGSLCIAESPMPEDFKNYLNQI